MKKKILFIILTLTLLMFSLFATPALGQAVYAQSMEDAEFGVDLAFGRRVVSSPHTDDNTNVKAVDANSSTRYASEENDNVYFYVDLGSLEKIGKIVIDWEAAYASEYQLLLSLDAVTWTAVAQVANTQQTIDEIILPAFIEAQFVKFQGIRRATGYGYSFYSFEVYGPKSLAAGSSIPTVSSYENEQELKAEYIVDNRADTRWASAVADNQYFIIDLGQSKSFDLIKIRWEVSFARIFAIFSHPNILNTVPLRDDIEWNEIVYSDVGLGEVDSFALESNASTRFLKVELVQRETSERIKKTGRLPWESTFSIYSFEIYDWSAIYSVPLGNVMEYSKNSPAWTAMSNITLNKTGLILAPIGYPIEANGVVTNLESIKDGNIPGFESYATYNPAVIFDEEEQIYHMIYRAELPDNFEKYFMDPKFELGHMSTLAYAYSYDGVNYTRGAGNPIAWPTSSDENGGGLEDPRMFRIKNDPNRGGATTYYVTYTMYDNHTTREGILWTTDFSTYHKEGRISEHYNDFGGAIKSGSFVTDPQGDAVLINDPRPGKTGKVYIIYMKDGSYTRIGFTTDVINIAPEDIIDIDSSGFGSNSIEALTKGNESCMAITNIYGEDDQDIYLMYGGGVLSDNNIQYQQPNVTGGWFYALGVLKTTKSNPFELTNVRLDLNEPTMYPTDTNKIDYGLFDKCMFADTLIRQDNVWYFYYGAGDMYVGLATARGDFSAGAVTFTESNGIVVASSKAVNKKYGQDQTSWDINFVAQVYDLDGALLKEQKQVYTIEHFLHSAMGIYSAGQDISLTIDLSAIQDMPEQYYITCYIEDKDSGEVLNNVSTYTYVVSTIISTGK